MQMDKEKNKSIFKEYALEDYPKVDSIKFPKEIYIAFAVCAKECGNREFIVDGQSQICEYCGGIMFRTEVKKYVISDE